ncbi:protein disaggregation chaperone [Escherichia coli]|uniref:Protein disaggregation chaperone n=1 Tax=Escherichia coli TaxID=562 RepID=A0A377C5J1_ECOLX|nr:protein disaggregation chaperone [Escherichia coli]
MVSHNFRPEFINRIDEVVVFHPLGEQHIASIAQIQLKRLYKRLEERGYEIHISDEALKLLSENGYDPVYGARPLNVLSSSRSKTRWHSKYCLVNWFRVK